MNKFKQGIKYAWLRLDLTTFTLRNSKSFKFIVSMFAGLFGTMFFVFHYLNIQGLITIGQASPTTDAVFMTFVISFLGGIWTMIMLDKWDR